jgi:hypothetical protein
MSNVDPPQELKVALGCLLMFTDDTGHEQFAGDVRAGQREGVGASDHCAQEPCRARAKRNERAMRDIL